MITALVLAAGRSQRMGSPKLLLTLRGHTLVGRVIAAARASRCDDVLVVLGEMADRVGQEAKAASARTVLNPRYREGMGTSIAAGIAALAPECDAVVVLLGDQPRVGADAINALIDAHRTTGKPLVASRYGNVVGVPALVARPLFAEAAALSGDVGARPLVMRHPDLVVEVPLPPEASLDVDTPEDLARLREAVDSEVVEGETSPRRSHKPAE